MNKTNQANHIYLYMSSIFIASLVTANIIAQKFFYWHPFPFMEGTSFFELSVGILPFPVTFLITDLISEIYGKKKATQTVIAGIFASFFSVLVIVIANKLPAIDYSPLTNKEFKKAFAVTPIAVLSSMLAYLSAQFIDIQVYHFWKKLTKGKHLWLRNNFSTFTSQFTDTFIIIFLLCTFNILEWEHFWGIVIAGFVFKSMIAALDTPLLYLAVWFFRKKFNLKPNEEIKG